MGAGGLAVIVSRSVEQSVHRPMNSAPSSVDEPAARSFTISVRASPESATLPPPPGQPPPPATVMSVGRVKVRLMVSPIERIPSSESMSCAIADASTGESSCPKSPTKSPPYASHADGSCWRAVSRIGAPHAMLSARAVVAMPLPVGSTTVTVKVRLVVHTPWYAAPRVGLNVKSGAI
eukprot:2860101-Prymnesium_polylepis.1